MVAGSSVDDPALDEVLGRARAGDGEAFGEIYGRLSRRVFGLCFHLLGSREDAEDATSEVFMKVRKALDRYDSTLPFRPWLIAIATRHCVDRLRRRRRDERLFDSDGESPVAAAAAAGLPPLAGLLAEEERAALASAVSALPERQRVPLVLRYHAEMSYDEIARHLGWTRERVAVSLFRAKQGLRRALGPRVSRP